MGLSKTSAKRSEAEFRAPLARLLRIAKSRQIGLHNQKPRLKIIVEYLGCNTEGQDLFHLRDDLGGFYAQGTLEEIEESLNLFTPMEIAY